MALKHSSLRASNLSMYFHAARPKSPGKKKIATAVGGDQIVTSKGVLVRAINNINFELEPGDRLALLGHNGAGKTTLLRLLAGIYIPQEGKVTVEGTMNSALNINLGFRDEATGRRNIELKALIGGLHRSQTAELIDAVEDFAELGVYLDAPLRTYSQGMRARLAFGIATAFRSDVLLLDEWLGAGDRAMREKAQKRMRAFVQDSSILVLASHNPKILRGTCNKGLVLNHGDQHFYGPIADAVAAYDKLAKRK